MAVKYTELLEEFIRDSGAEGAVLVSVDGLAIASVLPSSADEDRVAAMGAAILSLGERVASELNKGSLDQLYIKGSTGYVIFTGIKDVAVLGVLAPVNAKLGLLLMEIQRTIKKLEQELS
jgi:hypothetical protein